MNSNVPNSHDEQPPRHRSGMIATVLILTVLIGSLVVVTSQAHLGKKTTVSTSIDHSQTVQSQLGVYVGSGDGSVQVLAIDSFITPTARKIRITTDAQGFMEQSSCRQVRIRYERCSLRGS